MKRGGETERLTLVPDGGEEDTREISQRSLTRKWIGSYTNCKAARPAEGTVNPDGYTVIKSVLRRMKGGQGELTVVSSRQIAYAPGSVVTPIKDVISSRWDRTSRPLRQHPRWDSVSEEVWATVDAWEKEEDGELRKEYKYRVPQRNVDTGKWDHDEDGQPLYETKTLSASVQDYCDKRLNGIESYYDFHPVITRVRIYRAEPESGNCGKIALDCPRSVAGYEFLKVQDDVTNQGNRGAWSRTESWEGYESIDSDLYEAAAAGKAKAAGKRKGRAGHAS